MEDVDYLDWASLTLVIVGALNWGLMGLAKFSAGDPQAWNVVNLLLGGLASGYLEAGVYLLVGLAGLYQVYFGYEMSQT